MSTFSNTFNQILTLNGINEPLNVEKFEALYTALIETNKQYNLTAVTDETGVAALHFADSLMALPYLSDAKTVLDIGCGAGFPCLPIAIARPSISVTGVDSTAKKVDFSNKFANDNSINNFLSISARAEDLAKTEKRESFDLVTARAVSRLNVLMEITLPFVKVGGYFLAMKGSKGREELLEAEKGIVTLGGKVVKVEEKELILPDQTQKRTLILIKKVEKTSEKYPRQYSKIVKSPLK